MRRFNDEIKRYPIYTVRNGVIERYYGIETINDYNHYEFNLHHYIKDYERKKDFYDSNGIEQKLFLLPIAMHEQVHLRGIKTMTDEEFEGTYGISRWDLIYNRKNNQRALTFFTGGIC